MNLKNIILTTTLIFLLLSTTALLADQNQCYVAVDSLGSYDQLTITTISLTMLRQFVDPNIEPAPLSGFSEKGCLYRINVIEQDAGLKVFILGPKISDYGSSQLRGEPGLEQAILRGIIKSLNGNINSICAKYGRVVKDECEGPSSSPRENQDFNRQGDERGTYRNDNNIPPDCHEKPGVQLPEKCRMFYENNQDRQIPPDCHEKPGVQLPEKCRMFYENNGNRQIPPDCHKKPGVRLPEKCQMFYE